MARWYLVMALREMVCEDGRWMELVEDRVQWQALLLAVLNLQIYFRKVHYHQAPQGNKLRCGWNWFRIVTDGEAGYGTSDAELSVSAP